MGKGLIIALTGRARNGKDSVAEMLAEELFDITRKKFVLMAYAHELKLRIQKDFDLSYDQLWGDGKELPDSRYVKEEEGKYWVPREILQTYGQLFRTIDSNFWIKQLFKTIEDKEYQNVIITDVRHPNEADPVVARGGYVIKVTSERDNKEEIHGSNHISETAMDNYNKIDFYISNDGTIEELRVSAKQVAKFLIETENIKRNLEAKNG